MEFDHMHEDWCFKQRTHGNTRIHWAEAGNRFHMRTRNHRRWRQRKSDDMDLVSCSDLQTYTHTHTHTLQTVNEHYAITQCVCYRV